MVRNKKLKFKALFGASILFLGCFAAEARVIGKITNGHMPEDKPYQIEEYKNKYYLSCISKVNNAAVFTAPDIKKPYKYDTGAGMLQFNKGTDLANVKMIEVNGKQFLSGQILDYVVGGTILSWEKSDGEYSSDEDRDVLYVLPKDWDCRLHQGDREARCSSDAVLDAYAKLYKKYQSECQSKGK